MIFFVCNYLCMYSYFSVVSRVRPTVYMCLLTALMSCTDHLDVTHMSSTTIAKRRGIIFIPGS